MPRMQIGVFFLLFLSFFLPCRPLGAVEKQDIDNTAVNLRLSSLSFAVAAPAEKQINALVAKPAGVGNQLADKLPPIPASLVGHWFNTENSATVGLIIQEDKTCEMYTERLTSSRSSRGCKVEYYRDSTYLVYLKGANGQCGADADFEFRYIESQQRLDLDTGGGARFLLEKRPESPQLRN